MQYQEWLKIKQKHISATEYAAYMAACEGFEWFITMFELAMTKLFMSEEQYLQWQDLVKTSSMQAGKDSENQIISMATAHLQCEIQPNSEFIFNTDPSLKAGSTPDGFIVNNGERKATVEVKRTSQEYLTNLEKGYSHQVRFQLFTTGLENGLLYITKENPETKELEPVSHEFISLNSDERQQIDATVRKMWKDLGLVKSFGVDRLIENCKDKFTKRDQFLVKLFKAESTIEELIAEYNEYKAIEKLRNNKDAIAQILAKYLEEQEVKTLLDRLEYQSKSMACQILKKIDASGEYEVNGKVYTVEVKQNKDSVYTAKDIQEITDQAMKVANSEIQIGTFKQKGAVRLSVKEIQKSPSFGYSILSPQEYADLNEARFYEGS